MGLCEQLGATSGVWLSDPATQQQPHFVSRQTTTSDEDTKKTNAENKNQASIVQTKLRLTHAGGSSAELYVT